MVLHGELNFRNPAFAPLSYTTFAKYFLIPHIAVLLIADDGNVDLEGAWEIMSSSGSHGEALNALQDHDAILDEIFLQNTKRRVRALKAAEKRSQQKDADLARVHLVAHRRS
jgi:hypothetical protein